MIFYNYYWVINPLTTSIKKETYLKITALSPDKVISGNSPLGKEGKIFFDIIHHHETSLYNHNLWFFSDELFENQKDANRYNSILQIIGEALFDFKVSNYGLIMINGTTKEIIEKTLPQIENIQKTRLNKSDKFEKDEFHRLIKLTDTIYSLNENYSKYFIGIFNYLKDISLSPRFIGELALWSFIEHHWAKNKRKNEFGQSLKEFLETNCTKTEKKEINKKIKELGSNLGKEYNENSIRNILAHGQHFTLQEGWTEENWENFYNLHTKLYQLVIQGIEKEVFNKI